MSFFFNDTATTEIYTLSLHDALPILRSSGMLISKAPPISRRTSSSEIPIEERASESISSELSRALSSVTPSEEDRKSTRLNSSHANISHAVFCLKKKFHRATHLHP